MRTIERTTRFRKDYKRELCGRFGKSLDKDFIAAVALLASDQSLPLNLRDHPLTGALADCRDCHIRPDLVLIYRLPNEETLELLRLGSHSELGL